MHFIRKVTYLVILSFIYPLWSYSQSHEANSQKALAYRKKAQQYLIKSDSLWKQIDIHPYGISMYPESNKVGYKHPEFTIYWDEIPAFLDLYRNYLLDSCLKFYQTKKDSFWEPEKFTTKTKQKSLTVSNDMQPLAGRRIALDPGHIGGDMEMAKLEKKFMQMKASPEQNTLPVSFNEGNLTLATALLLKEKLEAAGAEVLITRTEIGKTAFGTPFQTWQKYYFATALKVYAQAKALTEEEQQWFLEKASPSTKFQTVFRYVEFHHRAAKINNFRPDISICIHYNVNEANIPYEYEYYRPASGNYNMAFIPGSFMQGELKTIEDRFLFLAKLLSNDISSSIRLSTSINKMMVKSTLVPLLEWDSSLNYLEEASLPTNEKGVFTRNLAMTRLINGPVCFGETLCQDNIVESVALNAKDKRINGLAYPSRIEDVVEGYFQGILTYFKRKD